MRRRARVLRAGVIAMAVRKRSHDIPLMLRRIRRAVMPYPKAAMFELADHGYRTLFQQVVACIISVRTYDEVSLPVAISLFDRAPTPADIASLDVAAIDRLIASSSFHRAKAEQIKELAERAVRDHGGELPCSGDVLRSFRGVGPKCANLALGVACGVPVISVDIHVHRVTNRWGYVSTRSPEETMVALGAVLPKRYWIEINKLLVPFGKHICTGRLPKCSTCPVLEMCRQVGVTEHR
ncbi:MAG TPA: endonuclease III [Gemmatimonadaceae bacterium]|nr:endonuclease III [Gemmatimonadaceae bacterium]